MPRFVNHKWDAVTGTVCERCKLERREYTFNGEKFSPHPGKKYEYYVNGKWIQTRPGCHDNKQFNETYIRL